MSKLYEPSLPKLMEAIATEAKGMTGMDRRNFLKGGIAAVAGLSSVQMIPKANASANLPPNLPEWQRHLGPGVVAKPYGDPSDFEDLQRRTVPWLTVDAASSISMTPLQDLDGIITPSGVVFERYHGGDPERESRSTSFDHSRPSGASIGPDNGGSPSFSFGVADPLY